MYAVNTVQKRRLSKFQFLDSVRGFLAFTVAFGHFSSLNYGSLWSIVDWFHTLIGVVGFFILSSFLLTYRLLFEFTLILSNTDKTIYDKVKLMISSLVKFTIRRITRIYPLYITVVLTVKHGPRFFQDALPGLPTTFWNTLFVNNSATNLTWTIRVEMIYYLFIPFICLFTSLCSKRFRILPVVMLIATCIYCDTHWTVQKCGGSAYCTHTGFQAWLSAFLAGSLLAIVYHWIEDYALSVSKTDGPNHSQQEDRNLNIFQAIFSPRVINLLNIFCYFMSISFILLLNRQWALLSLFNINYDELLLFNYPAYYWCLVMFSALLSRGSFANLFNNSFWNHTGRISFSIYLTHIIWGFILKKIMNPHRFRGFEGATVYMFLFMVSSTVTYYLIEYPGMWVGTKLCKMVDKFFDTLLIKKV